MTRLGIVSVALLLACHHDQPPPAKPSTLDFAVVTAALRMHQRYELAMEISDAIAIGDLDHARRMAMGTVGDEPDTVPRWRPYFQTVRAAAVGVQRAGDLTSAARATSQLGAACARCHEATAARIDFHPLAEPLGEPSPAVAMAGHARAAEQLWQGLIGPSDDRWLAGAAHLVAIPRDTGMDILVDVGLRARGATGDDRETVFAEVLTTCANCHVTMRP